MGYYRVNYEDSVWKQITEVHLTPLSLFLYFLKECMKCELQLFITNITYYSERFKVFLIDILKSHYKAINVAEHQYTLKV